MWLQLVRPAFLAREVGWHGRLICIQELNHLSRRYMSCNRTVAHFHRIIFMKVGGIFFIGIQSSNLKRFFVYIRSESQIAVRVAVLISELSKGYPGASSAPAFKEILRCSISSSWHLERISQSSGSLSSKSEIWRL